MLARLIYLGYIQQVRQIFRAHMVQRFIAIAMVFWLHVPISTLLAFSWAGNQFQGQGDNFPRVLQAFYAR